MVVTVLNMISTAEVEFTSGDDNLTIVFFYLHMMFLKVEIAQAHCL